MSALSDLAAGMSPGTWAELTQTNMVPILGQGPSQQNVLPYAHSMIWDPVSVQLHFIGGDHTTIARYITYSLGLNSWTDHGQVAFGSHEFNHLSIDPTTGTLYLQEYGSSRRVYYKTQAMSAWDSGTSLATWPVDDQLTQITYGTCWWSGAMSGAGANGALVIYNSGASATGNNPPSADGQVVIYDPLAAIWIDSITGFGPTPSQYGGTYQACAAYSAPHNVAVFGGGSATIHMKKVFRLNSDRTVTSMPDYPGGGSQVGIGVGFGNVVADPAGGDFLVRSGSEYWKLNPTGSGTWTQLPNPPADILPVTQLNSIVSFQIPEYGIVGYITMVASSAGHFYLYKHSASAAVPTPLGLFLR